MIEMSLLINKDRFMIRYLQQLLVIIGDIYQE